MHRARRSLRSWGLLLGLALLAGACGEQPEETSRDEAVGTAEDLEDAEGSDELDESDDTDGTDDAGEAEDADEDRSTAVGQGLSVAAPVYPLAWVAEQIAPGSDVTLLADQGEDPHDVELSPRDRELVETAEIVVYMGELDYQPQVEAAVEAAAGRVTSFTDAVGTDPLLTWDHDDHSHADDHDHDHDRGSYDPHAWFDAGGMALLTQEVGEAFAEVDPGNAEAYTANAATLYDEFMELDAEVDELLSGACTHDYIVVSHEAYAYLLHPYGHEQEGVSGTGGHGQASPQRIAELADMITEDGVEYVLTEPIEGREDAEGVAAEAHVELLEIYSLEVVDETDHFEERGFLELLREQAETAARALDCE